MPPDKDSIWAGAARSLRVPPRRIPGFPGAPVRRVAVRAEGPNASLALVLAGEALGLGPIHRTPEPPHRRDPRGGTGAPPVFDLRSKLPSAHLGPESLLARFEARYPGRRPRFVTGCGNLGANAGILAVVEGTRAGAPGPGGLWLAVDPSGRAALHAEPPAGSVFALRSPVLVHGGKPLPIHAGEHADPRHLLLFPYTETEAGVRVDLGLGHLLGAPEAYTAAVAGEAVRIPLEARVWTAGGPVSSPVPEGPLRKALATKGYVEAPALRHPGSFAIEGGCLRIRYLPGIYPHQVLAGVAGEVPGSILLTGASNRSGVVLAELAQALAAAGFEYALVVDNGGDVGAYEVPRRRFRAKPAEADRRRSWPLAAALVHHEESIGPGGRAKLAPGAGRGRRL